MAALTVTQPVAVVLLLYWKSLVEKTGSDQPPSITTPNNNNNGISDVFKLKLQVSSLLPVVWH
jgi:hypothetical protein